jgi:signal transduction histidine kinase
VTGDDNPATPTFSPALRRRTTDLFRRRLEELESPLGHGRETIEQLLDQVGSVLDDIEVEFRNDPVGGSLSAGSPDEIETGWATERIQPVDALRAAAALFEVLLPIVINEFRTCGVGEAALETAASMLYGSVTHRIGLGAVSYASFLRKKVTSSHQDERRWIARELHDHAAHAVGVALQDLDLHDFYLDRDEHRAKEQLVSARGVLHDALDAVRQVAGELRESTVEAGGLERALADYLSARTPAGVTTAVSVTGDGELPVDVCEELYVVLREAVRNALLHARPGSIEVTVVVDGGVLATVRDDGRGFDVPGALAKPSGFGLLSMRERVELLDGTMTITSAPGEGTTLVVAISQPGLDQ